MKAEEIKNIAEAVLEARHLFLVELSVSSSNVIELFIDSLTGVDVKACILVSKEIEQHLNRDDEDFELTVSSAGIGYPFKVEGQYRKNVGNTVVITLNDNTKLTGILKAFDAANVHLQYEEKKAVEGKKKKELAIVEKDIARSDIKQIKDVVTF